MLILRRKVGEAFLIGDQISITILDADAGGTVSIGIDAPKNLLIPRSELQQAVSANQDSALSPASPQEMESLENALLKSLAQAKQPPKEP